MVTLRSSNDIPDEIKNIIELFYLRGESAANKEAARLRTAAPEFAGIIDEVLQLFPMAPESVIKFYDALIETESMTANFESGLSFVMSDLLGDPGSDSISVNDSTNPGLMDKPLGPNDAHEDSFDAFLRKSLNNTSVPSIFADGTPDGKNESGQSYGVRGRELSANPPCAHHNDFNLDIDLDLDFGEPVEMPNGGSVSQLRLKNSSGLKVETSNEFLTPKPTRIQTREMDELQEQNRSVPASAQAVPSIMRASEKPGLNSELKQARRLADMLRSESVEADSHMRMTVPAMQAVPREGLGFYENKGSGAFASASSSGMRTAAAMPSIEGEVQNGRSGVRGLAALNKIQPIHRVPRLLCKMSELSQKSGINPKAGFILSMIDGQMSIGDILDISSWSDGETALLLLDLENMGIIAFE